MVTFSQEEVDELIDWYSCICETNFSENNKNSMFMEAYAYASTVNFLLITKRNMNKNEVKDDKEE